MCSNCWIGMCCESKASPAKRAKLPTKCAHCTKDHKSNKELKEHRCPQMREVSKKAAAQLIASIMKLIPNKDAAASSAEANDELSQLQRDLTQFPSVANIANAFDSKEPIEP